MNKISNAVNMLEEVITHSEYIKYLLFHALAYSNEQDEIIAFCDLALDINEKINSKINDIINILWKK